MLSPRASNGASTAAATVESGSEETWGVEVSDKDRAVWAAQEAMAERLPMVSLCWEHLHGGQGPQAE